MKNLWGLFRIIKIKRFSFPGLGIPSILIGSLRIRKMYINKALIVKKKAPTLGSNIDRSTSVYGLLNP
jgi:hypothetical protein